MTRTPPLHGPRKIDPLSTDTPGRYEDDLLSVVHQSRYPCNPHRLHTGRVTHTRHFCVLRNGSRPLITHGFTAPELDNDLAGRLAEELFAPGWLSGAEVFERAFTGIVKSTLDDPVQAWSTFYANTLDRIRTDSARDDAGTGHSSIEEIVPVYTRAMDLVPPGRILDMGSCFGFLALLFAERADTSVIASDVADGTVELLRVITRQRGLSLGTLICDAARIPLPDRAVDTVTAVHLLEHLDHEHGRAVLNEAIRLARRRVVVAVPFESEPTAAYGHVRTFSEPELAALGEATGRPFEVSAHHGGWLVVDCRDHPTSTSRPA